MKTILDIDEDMLRKVMEVSKSKTKKGAIVTALTEYLRLKKREELKGLIGNYKDFGLTLEDLKKMRHER
ncbi:MAG: type II toxin-antitoxin system VapB family antitoxin [Nitrospirota bacterium]